MEHRHLGQGVLRHIAQHARRLDKRIPEPRPDALRPIPLLQFLDPSRMLAPEIVEAAVVGTEFGIGAVNAGERRPFPEEGLQLIGQAKPGDQFPKQDRTSESDQKSE